MVSGGGEVQQELVKRLSEFVGALPVGKLETTTCKDAKDAVMPLFYDWVGVWKAHKPFFRCVFVFAWAWSFSFFSASIHAAPLAAAADVNTNRFLGYDG